jgi:hypothetical protein
VKIIEDIEQVIAEFNGVVTENQVFDCLEDNRLIIVEKGQKGFKETLYVFPENMPLPKSCGLVDKLNYGLYPNRTATEVMKIQSYAAL